MTRYLIILLTWSIITILASNVLYALLIVLKTIIRHGVVAAWPWLILVKENVAKAVALRGSVTDAARLILSLPRRAATCAFIFILWFLHAFILVPPLLALLLYGCSSAAGAAIAGAVAFSTWYFAKPWILSGYEFADGIPISDPSLKSNDYFWLDCSIFIVCGTSIYFKFAPSRRNHRSGEAGTDQYVPLSKEPQNVLGRLGSAGTEQDQPLSEEFQASSATLDSSEPKQEQPSLEESQASSAASDSAGTALDSIPDGRQIPPGNWFCKEADLYTPFSGGTQTRLLTLLPGEPGSMIRVGLSTLRDGVLGCELFHTRERLSGSFPIIPSGLKYEALSYVWGDANRTRTICLGTLNLIEGESQTEELDSACMRSDFPVTENLEAALQALRYRDKSRRLWVDALCVNQSNVSERSCQVRHMKMVYQCSSRTVAWLGDANKHTDVVMKAIREWSWNIHIRNSQSWSIESLLSVRDLMRRSWWSRIWTAQELIIPSDVLLMCGNHSISWYELVRAKENLQRHYRTCCSRSFLKLSSAALDAVMEFTATIGDLEKYRSLQRDPKHVGQGLLSVCAAFRHRLATDHRDKVFGLLSLANESSAITPNYAAGLAQIFTDVMKNDIRRNKTLQGLSYVLDCAENENFPSWVADWRHPPQNWASQMDRIARWSLYNASLLPEGLQSILATLEPCAEFIKYPSTSREILVATGWDVDHVIQIDGQIILDTIDALIDRIYSLYQEILSNESTSSLSYVAGGTKEAAFWSTLIMDSMLSVEKPRGSSFNAEATRIFQRAEPHTWKLCPAWWEAESRSRFKPRSRVIPQPSETSVREGVGRVPEGVENDIRDTLDTAMARCRFFVTGMGYFGLGPETMRIGDRIFVLQGSRVPVVLRSCAQSYVVNGQDGRIEVDYWSFVGTCYVQGIMDGDAVRGREEAIRTVNII